MPHDLDLILTLTGGLLAALLFGYVTHRLKLSPIVGYLLAGVAVGPFTPGFVAHGGIAEQLAELGVILLLFGVGLQFHIEELLAVRRVALPGAVAQIAVATLLGVVVAMAFGWSISAGTVFGLAISVASTVVLIRVLSDNDALHTPAGHLAVGWLVIEDLFTVLVLVMLPVLVGSGDASSGFMLSVGSAVLKIAALVAFTLIFGRKLIPKLLGYVAKTRSRELFTLTVLVLALGIAVGSAKLFGASMALGAFLAGIVVGQSDFSSRAASEALPMRDAFAVLFFVSMGMLFDPTKFFDNLPLTLVTLAIILIAKPLTALVVVLLMRRPPKVAVAAAVALAQIGEFSFILAALGRSLGVLPDRATQVLVAASIVSITLNPLLYRLVEPLSRGLGRLLARPRDQTPAGEAHEREAPAVILVGYGPVGRLLARLLRENGVEPLVLELNHETVRRLQSEGITALYGDASQPEILRRAGVAQARSLIFTAAAPPEPVIRAAREQNPELMIMVRATYAHEAPELARAGAEVVLTAENEIALAMVEQVLAELGATAEQLERGRERARQTLMA